MGLREVVTQEMIRMLARQLDYAPAADELPFTAQVMVDDLHRVGLSDVDTDRVIAAFRHLGPRTQRWPTARMVLECLPSKPTPKQLSAPKANPQFVSAQLEKIGTNGQVMRSVFRPGESYGDYLAALNTSGLSQSTFEAQRLAGRGWTADMERKFRDAAHVCHMGTLPGAIPEQIAAACDPEAHAEREAIQAEPTP